MPCIMTLRLLHFCSLPVCLENILQRWFYSLCCGPERALLRTQDTYSTPFLFLCPWIFIITSTIQFTSFALLPCVYKLRSTSPPWPSCVSMVPEPFPVFISRRAIKTPYTLHTHGSWLVAVIDYLLRMLYLLRYAIPNSTSHETTSYDTRSVHCMHT